MATTSHDAACGGEGSVEKHTKKIPATPLASGELLNYCWIDLTARKDLAVFRRETVSGPSLVLLELMLQTAERVFVVYGFEK